MMGQLKREIRQQRLLVMESRTAAAAHGHAFRYRLHHELGSPKALVGSFSAGLAYGLLRARPQPCEEGEAEHEAHGAAGPLLRWLVRDVAMPLVLGWISQLQAQALAQPEGPPGGA